MKKDIRDFLGKFELAKPIIGIYGVTSVGKSTFLNALLKTSTLKMGIGETTKKIHFIQHSKNNKKVEFENVSLEKEYIFKNIELLKEFSLVDVPGTNKSFSDNDIKSIIEKLDVIIWIFDIQSDVSRRDLDFLQNIILKNMLKTVVVLNKIDSGSDDIDFDDVDEYNEYILDMKSRRDTILNFFKNENAEELLVSILPISAKKLLSGVKKNIDSKFIKQHKELENILTTVAKSAFRQKQIFKNDYDKVKSDVELKIESEIIIMKSNQKNNVEQVLTTISDKDIVDENYHQQDFLNNEINFLEVRNFYKNELKLISQKLNWKSIKMSKIEQFSQQLEVQKDIDSITGFEGVDTLNRLKEKYKEVTLSFTDVVKYKSSSMEEFIQARGSVSVLTGLFEKFDRNSINISVVAEVSSGKSTFLNALIFGKKVLDAKLGETTAKVFKISYGENQSLDVLKEQISNINKETKEKISKEKLSEEELKNLNIEDYIFELKADNENLKKGIVLYDTPGFGTLNERVMSKLIAESVNRSDAVILLLDLSKGLKKDDARFIEEALAYIEENKRFIVLNKFDASIDEDDDIDDIQEQIDQVVEDTKKGLLSMSKGIDKTILDKQTYYLSALKGLTGKSKNRPDVLEFSRFPIFEEAFWKRIVEAKKETFSDAINILLKEAIFVHQEAQKRKDSFSQIINQTNSLVENMENVSVEIKDIIEVHSKKIEEVIKTTALNTTIVFDKASSFEKSMNLFIKQIIQVEIGNIPTQDVTENHFNTAAQNVKNTINEEFKKQYKSFLETISNEMIEKEKIVNLVIDNLNENIQSDKFKELNLQLIPRIENDLSNSDAIELHSQNHINLEEQKNIESGKSILNNISNLGVFESKNISDSVGNIGAGATAGAAAGAAIGSAVPILGTAIGGAIGGVLGGLAGLLGGSNDGKEQEAKHQQQMQEMQRQHQEQMQKMEKENYRREIEQAKKELIYELNLDLKEQSSNFIAETRATIDNDYRITLSEITSSLYNAKNILNDMQTIIEDPSEQKRVIKDNELKIQEIQSFIDLIDKCFEK